MTSRLRLTTHHNDAEVSSTGDVLLLDGRSARPSVVYRSIVRIRNSGWDRGIVLLVDPGDLSMVPVASSIGATDFVLSSASEAETSVRLRRASGLPSGDNTT